MLAPNALMNLYFFLKLKINSADSISHFRFRLVKRLLPAEIPGLLHTPAGIGLWFAEQNLIRWRGNIILANAEWLCVCCMWCKMNMRKAILTPREVLAREVSSLWLNLHQNGILEFCLPSMLSLAGHCLKRGILHTSQGTGIVQLLIIHYWKGSQHRLQNTVTNTPKQWFFFPNVLVWVVLLARHLGRGFYNLKGQKESKRQKKSSLFRTRHVAKDLWS